MVLTLHVGSLVLVSLFLSAITLGIVLANFMLLRKMKKEDSREDMFLPIGKSFLTPLPPPTGAAAPRETGGTSYL